MKLEDEKILIFDGAAGSGIHAMDLPASAWGRYEGCNEYLNLSAPDAIASLHTAFLDAGAMVIETNTFGASPLVLAEYGLEAETARINHAAVDIARNAVSGRERAWVAGSVGPTTKLPSLGHIAPADLAAAFRDQIRALVEAGVDLLIIETCQDLLQAKTALVTCFEVFEELSRGVPVSLSVTVETTGTMLVGTEIAAAAVAIEPFDVFSLGLNCATGPELMKSSIRHLGRRWPGRISCIPNAGIPEIVDGKACFPLSPAGFASSLKTFVEEEGVSIVGGCCGTTPEHIRCLAGALEKVTPAAREPEVKPSITSSYQAVSLGQEIPPLLIGERANTNGSKKFRKLLLADDFDGALQVGTDQQKAGAHAVDLCTAYAGRDERADLTKLTGLFARSVRVPTVIDSTSPDCIEACLKLHPGRCVINSINLEDGGRNLGKICRLAKKYGAAVVALTIGEKGMAMTADDKVATARAIHDLAVGRYGLRPWDILFDPLTFTIGSGDLSLDGAALETLEALRRIKEELPGVFTLLGVSNISFGLEPKSRRILNSVFLHEAVGAGLDAAIVDAARVVPFSRIAGEDREICLDLIHCRRKDPERTPLVVFIEHFADRKEEEKEKSSGLGDDAPPEKALTDKVLAGDRKGLPDLLAILLERRTPVSVINEILVPAMRHVGELFGSGKMLLPFVLQSAEVMRRSVDFLEPFMEKKDEGTKVRVLLATVQGDVHDIGKNLVDIILSNNGYTVFNLGIRVPAETIIAKAREHVVDVIGLSGLLVKSALAMQESMAQYRAAGLKAPILLGGAALTRKFVAESCVPAYDAPVVYCADAFAGLKAVRDFETGTLQATTFGSSRPAGRKAGRKVAEVSRDNRVPELPCPGARVVDGIDVGRLYSLVNEQALFRGRWGYRRGRMDAGAYRELIDGKVRPLYDALKGKTAAENLIQPRVATGYFRCRSEGNTLFVEKEGREISFSFPRQGGPPHLCIADFFKTREEGGDVVAFFVATIGERLGREAKRLFEGDEYRDYLLLHGLGVEVTEALAEHWHEEIRNELGIGAKRPVGPRGGAGRDYQGSRCRDYQGSRYGFGYSACPDLDAQKPLFELLDPASIGVRLTENMEMVPEMTTSAIVAHHPQAKYFAI
jgi:5-methyltetrahydrofolate--homocysteine methyltransferase